MMFHTYILRRKNKEFYIGYTDNLERRMREHQYKYPCELVYYEAYQTEELARKREKKLKQYGSAWRALRKRITE